LDIGKALTFDQDDINVEAVFSLTEILQSNKTLSANFTYNAAEKENSSLALLASGCVRVYFGEPSTTALPERSPRLPNLFQVQSEEFYESMEKMEYQYSGPFKALIDLERRLGYATGRISILERTDLIIHPAILDAAFHSTFLALSAPFDGRIWALQVPKAIRSVRINPGLCTSVMTKDTVSFDSVQLVESSELAGDVNIYPSSSQKNAILQVQGLTVSILVPVSVSPDLWRSNPM
jgi:hybrid polyketide synthase/nonribosomal peptide synthetase ACE1